MASTFGIPTVYLGSTFGNLPSHPGSIVFIFAESLTIAKISSDVQVCDF